MVCIGGFQKRGPWLGLWSLGFSQPQQLLKLGCKVWIIAASTADDVSPAPPHRYCAAIVSRDLVHVGYVLW